MMTKTILAMGGVVCLSLAGCSSSSSPATVVPDGGHDAAKGEDGGSKKDSGPAKHDGGDAARPTPDAGHEVDAAADVAHEAAADAGADASVVRHVLVTYDSVSSGATPSTMVALNLATHAVDGTLHIADSQAITDTSYGAAPFLLEQSLDVVSELDPSTWKASGSWSVALPGDAGGDYSDPYAVTVASPTKVYVLRYNTNVIDVLDITHPAVDGKPASTIDLTSLVQPKGDGTVHAAAGFYDATDSYLYVVLQNINLFTEDDYQGTYYTLCSGTTSSLIAIDTATDQVVSLHGTAPGGGIALTEFDPTSIFYDVAGQKLLTLNAGCYPPPTTDAGAPGAHTQAGIEVVDLATHATRVLVDTSAVKGFPGSFVVDTTHVAAVGFQYPTAVYFWDPTTTSLGPVISKDLELFDHDGEGNLVGVISVAATTDGGAPTTSIVSLSLATRQLTTLKADVLPLGEGYVASVGVWPRP